MWHLRRGVLRVDCEELNSRVSTGNENIEAFKPCRDLKTDLLKCSDCTTSAARVPNRVAVRCHVERLVMYAASSDSDDDCYVRLR